MCTVGHRGREMHDEIERRFKQITDAMVKPESLLPQTMDHIEQLGSGPDPSWHDSTRSRNVFKMIFYIFQGGV